MDKEALLISLKKQGFSEQIINAFAKVKRENFIPENYIAYTYDDIALPLEIGSTISQPSTIAFMLSLLDLKDSQKILEIGSGSGYALALISEISNNSKVYGLEINKKLAIKSKKTLSNYENIEIISRSGETGLPEFAPFDRILISAACPDMRIPSLLTEQLSDPGFLVAAVKQSIVQIKKQNKKTDQKEFPGFLFVPLVHEG